MKKISLMFSLFLLAVLARPTMTEGREIGTGEAEQMARVCAVDVARRCNIPIPRIDDYQEDGKIFRCLRSNVSQLSRACSDAVGKAMMPD